MRYHQVSKIFPMMNSTEIQDLADDIKTHGQREPIWLHSDGSIIDGRNRYEACKLAKVNPDSVTYNDPDDTLLAFVISLNLKRRHLNETQRGMIAARLARATHGGDRSKVPIGTMSLDDAAEKLRVGRRTAARCRSILKTGTDELVAAADSGDMPAHVGASVAKKPAEAQREIARMVTDGEKPSEASRTVRKRELLDKAEALPDGTYRVIYADPPWEYGDTRAGLDAAQSAAEHHYPTMPLTDICALPVADMAADDSVLFCWATFPTLQDAFDVVKAWGFKYKTAFVWSKLRPNLGHYHQADAELLLVATRGSCTPDAKKRETQVQSIKRTGKHSSKPEDFRAMIDRMYPTGNRVELFRRGKAPKGWEIWGNESK